VAVQYSQPLGSLGNNRMSNSISPRPFVRSNNQNTTRTIFRFFSVVIAAMLVLSLAVS
jgi:hypothetical protein